MTSLFSFVKCYKYPLLWALFIGILCGFPGKDIPHVSILELLEFDKWIHAGVFFILVFLLSRAYQTSPVERFRHHAILFAFCIAVCYGGLLEILQATLFIDRSADVYDFIANSFGALVAVGWIKKIGLKKS